MTLTITPAALHAALMLVAQAMGERRHEAAESGVEVLLVMTDPAHQVTEHAAGGGAAWATTPEAKRPAEPCYDEAGTPAPPTITLPAGPEERDVPRADPPAAAGVYETPEAPPPAQAAAGQPIVRHRGARGEWTAARDALLREEGPTETDREALLARINALPGAPIANRNALAIRMSFLAVRMTPETARIVRAQAGQRGGLAARAPHAATSEQRTPARTEAFRQLWMDPALTVPQIMVRLNALPGAQILHPQSLYKWARATGMPSQRPVPRDTLAARGITAHTQPDPREAENMPIEVKRPPDLDADDHRDGDARIRAGWNPRQVADYLGCTIAAAELWCRTLREADQVAAELAKEKAA